GVQTCALPIFLNLKGTLNLDFKENVNSFIKRFIHVSEWYTVVVPNVLGVFQHLTFFNQLLEFFTSSEKVINTINFSWSFWTRRKSTRLNSSHVSSSYAVFCWKKKTNTAGTNYTRNTTREYHT